MALALAMTLGSAREASAQGTGPFANCKVGGKFVYTGPGLGVFEKGSATGDVVIECDGTQIFAQKVEWTPTTITAEGELLVTQNGLRVNADRMEMDRETRLGTFFNAYGTARLTEAQADKSMFGTMEPEIWFHADRIERLGPRTYKLTNGVFSTCVQPTARWEMRGTSGTVVLDDHVILKNVQFRVKGVPVIYLPYLYYPIESDDRATGFLLPVYSASGVKGQGLSNAFFWAINRSHDATFNYDWYSKAGQAFGSEYRYAAEGSNGDVRFFLLDEKEQLNDNGTVRPAARNFQVVGGINQRIGKFQLIGSSNYFSDITTQQRYQQNVAESTNRQRVVRFTLGGYVKTLRIDTLVERNDVFTGETAVARTTLPQVRLSLADRELFKQGSQIYFVATGEAVHFERPDPAGLQPTVSVSRFDGTGTVRAPLTRGLLWLNVGTSAAWHVTQWLDSRDPLTGLEVPVPITRSLLDLRAEVGGPKLERIFKTPNNKFAEKFRHVIEPGVSVQYLSPFAQKSQVIQMDQVDQLVGGTTTLSYNLVNRISANVRRPEGGSQNREILRVSIGQSYYTNAAAAAVDPNYPPGIPASFSAVQLQADFRPTVEVTGRFQVNIDPIAKAPQSYSATAGINKKRVQLFAGWSKTQYLPAIPAFSNPNAVRHALNASASFGTLDGRFGGTYNFNLDVFHQKLIQQRIIAYYHAQCCGIAFDYQISNVSSVADRRMSISFTLAGIGSFSPPLGAFGR
jgi:LPS-assembly protein